MSEVERLVDIDLEGVDKQIYQYLDLDNPVSFLLFAGAGSGKTRTLVNVLKEIRRNDLKRYINSGSKVAIIAYTNAACNEIKQRLQFDPMFRVSTIHSFAWELIKPFTDDIREFLRENLQQKIDELQGKIDKAKDKEGKTAVKNAKSRDSKQIRLDNLDKIVEFTYSLTVNKPEKDALNHAEVISISADFIANQPLMQRLLINRFPVLLIDESQDTAKMLMNAFIKAQQENKKRFALGLFGDMMQRIYNGGKEDLDSPLPDGWMEPEKLINYRCPKRVINLINNIRKEVDGRVQEPKEGALEGVVRLFIVDSDADNKFDVEVTVKKKMKDLTDDDGWGDQSLVKCLTLEHAMAAHRGGFQDFFMPLTMDDDLKDSALNGTSKEIRFITELVLPLLNAISIEDEFEIARIVKLGSSLLSADNVNFLSEPIESIKGANEKAEELKQILLGGDIDLRSVLKYLSDSHLLDVPEKLSPYLAEIFSGKDSEDDRNKEAIAWDLALNASIDQVHNYSDYVHEKSGFATHQGVKGLEFERVMAVLDDADSKGFLFKYEKILGAEPLSPTDMKNQSEGSDSTPLRTRRLFYVICSRAEKSLAIVAYTKNPKAVKAYATQSWFEESEVVMI